MLKNRKMQAGLRYLGLGTRDRAIPEYREMFSGLRYLGYGTCELAILNTGECNLGLDTGG